jgi:hypothetical protein
MKKAITIVGMYENMSAEEAMRNPVFSTTSGALDLGTDGDKVMGDIKCKMIRFLALDARRQLEAKQASGHEVLNYNSLDACMRMIDGGVLTGNEVLFLLFTKALKQAAEQASQLACLPIPSEIMEGMLDEVDNIGHSVNSMSSSEFAHKMLDRMRNKRADIIGLGRILDEDTEEAIGSGVQEGIDGDCDCDCENCHREEEEEEEEE